MVILNPDVLRRAIAQIIGTPEQPWMKDWYGNPFPPPRPEVGWGSLGEEVEE